MLRYRSGKVCLLILARETFQHLFHLLPVLTTCIQIDHSCQYLLCSLEITHLRECHTQVEQSAMVIRLGHQNTSERSGAGTVVSAAEGDRPKVHSSRNRPWTFFENHSEKGFCFGQLTQRHQCRPQIHPVVRRGWRGICSPDVIPACSWIEF